MDNPGESSTSWTLVQCTSRPALAGGAVLTATRDKSRATRSKVLEGMSPHVLVAAKAYGLESRSMKQKSVNFSPARGTCEAAAVPPDPATALSVARGA
jgi:hypothetical protein